MTLIEGVGDEVVQFVGVVLVVVVAALAWWSTNARPDRYRTVLVMRPRSHHAVTISIRARQNMLLQNTSSTPASTTDTSTGTNTAPPVESSSAPARVIPLQEMDSIVDADMAMLDNNRLHFYRRIDSPSNQQSAAESTSDESETQEEPEASRAQIREMDSIVSAMEADVTTNCDFFTRNNDQNSSTSNADAKAKPEDSKKRLESAEVNADDPHEGVSSGAASDPGKKILIKLKYLNDTLKEVEGSLDELLKDFKWRHFSSELSSECRVRLIFNGRVLGDEAATLRACGLHHRAVVHALVHPGRAAAQRGSTEEAPINATHELIAEGAQPDRTWDLENILMTLVSVALTVVWFFRCEYSNMFTASASVALFGLTVFYSVAIFGLYLSDTFHLDRRAAPAPAPAPPPPAPAPAPSTAATTFDN